MISWRIGCIGALALVLAACASPPVHYYTLMRQGDSAGALLPKPASFVFSLLPVSIPPQLDQAQLVVRSGVVSVLVLNGRRWLAPLADEVHSALAAELAHDTGAQNVSGLPPGNKPMVRIKVNLHRFDAVPARYVLLDANWSVRSLTHKHVLVCSSRIRKHADSAFAALVAAQQQALAELARRIASVTKALSTGRTPKCPPG